jgi:hypothetical protein
LTAASIKGSRDWEPTGTYQVHQNRSILAVGAILAFLAVLEAAGVEFKIGGFSNLLMARDF